MPHISKKKISEKIEQQLEERMLALLNNTSTLTRRKVFSELLTKTERIMLVKRLTLIFLVSKDLPTHTISSALKVSPSTVARYEDQVIKGRWKTTITWLSRNEVETKFTRAIEELFEIFLGTDGKPQNLNQYLKKKI